MLFQILTLFYTQKQLRMVFLLHVLLDAISFLNLQKILLSVVHCGQKKFGTSAAIATIEYFIENNVADKVRIGGKRFRKIMKDITSKYGYTFKCRGGIEGWCVVCTPPNHSKIIAAFAGSCAYNMTEISAFRHKRLTFA